MSSPENSDSKKTVKCPQCGRLALYAPENPFRPFCSERCRIIDLGQWASESFRIPVEQDPASSESDISDDDSEKYE